MLVNKIIGNINNNNNNINSRAINIKYPPVPMISAVGDGITNDSNVIQAIIDYVALLPNGGTIYFPAGTYMVRNVNLKQSVNLIGSGYTSIIKSHSSCVEWDYNIKMDTLTGVRIEKLTFDGNKTNVTGNDQGGVGNVYITNSTDVTIQNCTFQHNWYANIIAQNSNIIKILDNEFYDSDCGFITTSTPSNNILIDGNYFDGAAASEPISIYGLAAGYHENVVITNNIMKNHTGGAGILIRATKKLVIANNIIMNCNTGIYTDKVSYSSVDYPVYDAIISDNVISDTTYEGMLLYSLIDSNVKNNDVKNTGTTGITTDLISYCSICKNKITNVNAKGDANSYYGIWAKTMNNCLVSENVFVYTRQNASCVTHIQLSGTSSLHLEYNNFISNSSDNVVIPLFILNGNYAFNNIFASNIGKMFTSTITGNITINNIDKSLTTLPTIYHNTDWGTLNPSPLMDTFFINTPDGGSTNLHLDTISSSTSYIGRVIKLIFGTTYFLLQSSSTLSLRSAWSNPPINASLTLVWNGTKWQEINRTGDVIGSKTYDPPSLSTGTQTSTTLTVTGASLGDIAQASFSLDLQLVDLTAYVSSTDTVTCVFRNNTAGTIDLASGTLKARVIK